MTATLTHLSTITTRTDKSHGIHRLRHRHRCTCGVVGKERAYEQEARADLARHERGLR